MPVKALLEFTAAFKTVGFGGAGIHWICIPKGHRF